MFPKDVPLNLSSLFVEHVLYNGCKLYFPLEKESDRDSRKAQLRAFNSWQMAMNPLPPEYA